MTKTTLPAALADAETPLDTLRTRLETDRSFTTRTGTVDLIHPPAEGEPPLMIKQSPQWTADHARGLWLTLDRLRSYAAKTGLAPFAATPHQWGADPAYICSDWVEGSDVIVWFSKTFADNERGEAFSRSLEMSRHYASLLAHYHRAMSDMEMLADVIPRKLKTVEQSGLAVRLIRMLRGRKGVSQAERVRSIDDPGPHNMVEAADGTLWLIDLPAHFEVVMVERDVARFADRQVGATRRFTALRWLPRLGHYRRIVTAVVEGYESVGSPKRKPLDLSLIYACLAADAALKTARTRGRLARGARLEGFVRELFATVLLAVGALWLRFSQPAPRRHFEPISTSHRQA